MNIKESYFQKDRTDQAEIWEALQLLEFLVKGGVGRALLLC